MLIANSTLSAERSCGAASLIQFAETASFGWNVMRSSVERPPTGRYDGYLFYGALDLTLEEIVFIRVIALGYD
jgi:hypothetical protein